MAIRNRILIHIMYVISDNLRQSEYIIIGIFLRWYNNINILLNKPQQYFVNKSLETSVTDRFNISFSDNFDSWPNYELFN